MHNNAMHGLPFHTTRPCGSQTVSIEEQWPQGGLTSVANTGQLVEIPILVEEIDRKAAQEHGSDPIEIAGPTDTIVRCV